MAKGADWPDSNGASLGHPRLLAQGLAILAQFDGGVVLDSADIAGLIGCSRSFARRYLLTLCDLGYLTEDHRGACRLAGVDPGLVA